MNMLPGTINVFRLLLISSLLLIIWFATMELAHPLMSGINDKLGHVLAFVYLAFVLDFSFPQTQFDLTKIVSLLAYGLLLETIQYFLPYRTFSLLDMLADGVGIATYFLMSPLLRYVPILRHRWDEKPESGARS